MSDVIAAAAIAGAVGLAGNIATVMATRYTAAQETLRRRQDQEHQDRTLRQEKYSDLAWCLERLHKYGRFGDPPNEAEWKDWLDLWANKSAVVLTVGSEDVVREVEKFTGLLAEIGPSLLATAAKNPPDWSEVYENEEPRIDAARQALLATMRS